MTDISQSVDIKELVRNEINLPSPPAIAVQILNTIRNTESSLDDLEKIISADPALTSKLLRIANSAFYSLPNDVTNVNRAISILGTNVIKNIALSFVIARDLRGTNSCYFNFDYFWRRSVTAAVAAELVSKMIHHKSNEIFVAGLLQDLGVLVMYISKGGEYENMLHQRETDLNLNLLELEQKTFNFDHQQLSSLLLENWCIPDSISEPIRYHHSPADAPINCQTQASILHVSNLLSAIYTGQHTAEKVMTLQEKMAALLDINAEQTRFLLDEVAQKAIDVLSIFEIDPGAMKPYSQMLQEANDELGKLNLSYEQLVLELKESKERAEQFAVDLRTANERLEQLAFRDGLTNLFNHRYFQEILGNELARARRYKRPLCLLMFDIDHFKKVNDTYGHPAGDKVLINLANAIRGAVRPSDIISRYGGEEVTGILPETSASGMRVFAERLRRCAAAAETEIGGEKIAVTISCGGVEYLPDSETSQQNLIDAADRGLYASKKNGRNRVTIVEIP